MSDADKLSAPSYEPFDAGVPIGDAPLRNGKDAPRTIEYVTKIIDDYQAAVPAGHGIYQMPAAVHAALASTRVAAATATHRAAHLRPAVPQTRSRCSRAELRGRQHRST